MAHAALDLAYDATTDKIYACYVDGGICLGTLNVEKGDLDRIADTSSPLLSAICPRQRTWLPA